MGRPNKGKGKISRAELDKRLEECYDSLYERALALCMEHDTQIVASTMLAQALRLYKTVLTDDDFTAMVQTVVETADQIQPYKARSVH